MGLEFFLRDVIREGQLRVRWPGGALELGDGLGPPVEVLINSNRWVRRIVANPSLSIGEAYMAGGLVVTEGTLQQLVDLIGQNAKYRPLKHMSVFSSWWLDRRIKANSRAAASKNVTHHYDLNEAFFRLFLDDDLQYSCAYFMDPDYSLDDAQITKKQRLMTKLLLAPGQRVLDIGCGWGGLALSMAANADVKVEGITLSREQLEAAKKRAAAQGLGRKVRFDLRDYRDVTEPFDRVVSVGMLEHVGRKNFDDYFGKIAEVLKDDGVAVVHAIGRADGPAPTEPWIAKYIFPGGYIPALSEVLAAVERSGLMVADIEIMRLHYAQTLQHWTERFLAHRDQAQRMYGERFCRMWEFYLAISELAFRYRGHMVFQLQLAKHPDTVPTTRGYLEGLPAALPEAAWRAA